MGDDRGDRGGDPGARRPPPPSEEQRARWSRPGYDRFRDAEHQRWAQGHRSAESLREAGHRGYAAMRDRAGGEERVLEHGRAYRLAKPSLPERWMFAELGRLGLEEGRDYHREYPVRGEDDAGERRLVFPDIAWPGRRLALEVDGDIHAVPAFRPAMAAREALREQTYRSAGWRTLIVTERELRADRAAVRARVRAVLAGPDGPGPAGGREEGHDGRGG